MSRKIFGPSQAGVVVAPTDSVPTITSIVGTTVHLNVPTVSGTPNYPDSIHVAFMSAPPTVGETPDQALAASVAQGNVGVAGAGDTVVSVSGVPAGTYDVVVIPEYTV